MLNMKYTAASMMAYRSVQSAIRTGGLLFLAFLMFAGTSVAQAQRGETFSYPDEQLRIQGSIPRTFPMHAKRGKIRFLKGREVKIGRRRVRLSPISRIKGPRNAHLDPNRLIGKSFQIMYTQDPMRQVSDVWILSKLEMQRPSPQQKREQLLRSQGIDPDMFNIDPLTPYHKRPRYPGY